jgi:hypothetical protein
MKAGTQDAIKFKKLMRRLQISRPLCTGLLEELWHFTAKDAPRGDIGKYSNEDIATAVGWEGDHDEFVNALIEYGWLDTSDEFRLVVHKWSKHAPNYVKGNVVKSKQTFADEPPQGIAVDGGDEEPQGSIPKGVSHQTKPNQVHSIQVQPSQTNETGVVVCGGDGFAFGKERKDELIAEANRLHFAILSERGVSTPADREIILRAAILHLKGVFPESVLAESLAAIKQKPPDNPVRYFRGCIRNQSKLAGLDENLIDTVPIPPWAQELLFRVA